MSAGKTISLYLESQERSLPLPARAAEELFEPALSLCLSSPRPLQRSFYTVAVEWKLTVYQVLIMPRVTRSLSQPLTRIHFSTTFCTPPSIITSLHLEKNLFELGIISRVIFLGNFLRLV